MFDVGPPGMTAHRCGLAHRGMSVRTVYGAILPSGCVDGIGGGGAPFRFARRPRMAMTILWNSKTTSCEVRKLSMGTVIYLAKAIKSRSKQSEIVDVGAPFKAFWSPRR
jgi:hypothetical protein